MKNTTIKFNILSPDGFPFHREPLEAVEPMLVDTARKELEKVKERYKAQGYYSSIKGRIPLEDLEEYCTLDVID